MSQKLRSKSLSSPEILRRDPYAFVDWHHDPRNVHITDILLDREEGSQSARRDPGGLRLKRTQAMRSRQKL